MIVLNDDLIYETTEKCRLDLCSFQDVSATKEISVYASIFIALIVCGVGINGHRPLEMSMEWKRK